MVESQRDLGREVRMWRRDHTMNSWSDNQREAIAQEMERVLSDPKVNSSNHCAKLLRYLIEHALQGDHPQRIKERTLGIEVFGRLADYDTSSDPVVRTTASEIRRRLSRHYEEPGAAPLVKIRLAAGSYVPQFDFEEAAHLPIMEPIDRPVPKLKFRKIIYVCILLTMMAGAAILRANLFPSTTFLIWKPLLKAKMGMIVCVNRFARQTNPKPDLPKPSPRVTPFVDATVAQKISIRLSQYGQSPLMRSYDELSPRGLPI